LLDILVWFIAIETLGMLAFPLAFLLFSRLPDRGYTFAKPLALILVSYALWMLGLTQFLPNSAVTILAILVVILAISGWLLHRHKSEILSFLRSEWKIILVAEGVFLGFFIFWLLIVSDVPAINHTEKPMDFAFMNAILQSSSFPPEDPWLAGHPISYYYFGHFMMAAITKLTTVASPVGYNLAVALVPALLAMGVFGLVSNLIRLSGGRARAAISFGLVATALLILIGNLEGALELANSLGLGGDGFWQWIGIKGLDGAAANPGAFPEQPGWWWRATRVIDTLQGGQSLDYTITEFPFFSFILGDLHPHMVSLPFLVMFLGVALNLLQTKEQLGLGWLIRHPLESAMVALLLGSLAFINAWDFPVFAAILALVILTKAYGQAGSNWHYETANLLSRPAANSVLMIAPIAVLSVILFLPFYLDLSSQASGILPVTGPGTRPFLFLVVMGLFSLLAITFLAKQLPGVRRPTAVEAPSILLVALISAVPLLLWILSVAVVAVITGDVSGIAPTIFGRMPLVIPGLVIAGLAAFSALQRIRHSSDPTTGFALLLLATAFYLQVGAELFFLVDLFGNRMNTVFKVYFQSWLLLAVVGAYGLYYCQAHWRAHRVRSKTIRYGWAAVLILLVAASIYYSTGALIDRTGIMTDGYRFSDKTLDGLAFLNSTDPAEYAAVVWLRDTADKGRIVEAVGDDYSSYGRISSSTGLPTILGWPGHEQQWRGKADLYQGRAEEVASIYQSDDQEEVLRVLDKYGVRYVYLGLRERASYGGSGLTDFASFMRTAFESPGVVIYQKVEN
jgi:YYY domain-containing protein